MLQRIIEFYITANMTSFSVCAVGAPIIIVVFLVIKVLESSVRMRKVKALHFTQEEAAPVKRCPSPLDASDYGFTARDFGEDQP